MNRSPHKNPAQALLHKAGERRLRASGNADAANVLPATHVRRKGVLPVVAGSLMLLAAGRGAVALGEDAGTTAGKVGDGITATVDAGKRAAGAVGDFVHNQTTLDKMPTVKEYDADPAAFPGYEKIQLGSDTPSPWALAKSRMADRDPREASDMLLAQDAQNEADGFGHEGFDAGDPMIVPRAPENPPTLPNDL
jgi:hypothetical protein